ncbi:hypothetical protein TWF569_010688 [Orbilia oligospora]|uniref:Ilp is an apoptosis inhibitor n=2 Tax=Orbilia oligospora TaxID=2813651 RepID=A0A7C8JHW8_ORBOL|nr:hypothetical protein TWF706_003422 [Orbilia oligospora]KAF3085207.1 hypothetical protein TWF102_011683 [Orbilia oligospora]KAF3101516.1 hypothetical protein TWF103_007931 [Orbilia oligospora]KAF3119416.1 hypothetical protein TWF703_003345 [Orbilia oligospora]KAF3133245.1 hypothetical protein TWF569_010688 [Orbilia oligospora]
MSYQNPANPSSSHADRPRFDIIAWYPHYQSCLKYFLNTAQHSYPCQALAAFLNIRLPYQQSEPANEYVNMPPASPGTSGSSRTRNQVWVSLIPYIRRLVATGFDKPGILHGWFGDDWALGIGPMHESERRNFLFAAKSGGWSNVKKEYDQVSDEAIPFLRPLDNVGDAEVRAAEASWSDWLALEDWMFPTTDRQK